MSSSANTTWTTKIWSDIKDWIEAALGNVMGAGQLSLYLFLFMLFFPDQYDAIIAWIGIPYHVEELIFRLMLILMFVGGPLMLYSGFVGYWRMADIADGSLRMTGRVTTVVIFLLGLSSLVISVLAGLAIYGDISLSN